MKSPSQIKFICFDVRLTQHFPYMSSRKRMFALIQACTSHEASSKCKSEKVDVPCPYITSFVVEPPNITWFLPPYHLDIGDIMD